MVSCLRCATAIVGVLGAYPTLANAQSAKTATAATQATAADRSSATTVDADGKAAVAAGADTEILVTGSRIRRPETDGVLPGLQVGAQQIETRGFTNAIEALTDIPLVGRGANPGNNANGTQAATYGAAFVNLLDVGTQRTLTLVNGRRFVSGNAASLFVYGNQTGSQVDVNVLPTSLISRVDVVTVGGAAAYGTDAIAGVVNYILKEDFKGIEAKAVSGVSERGDGSNYQVSLTAGHNFLDGRANLSASLEYDRTEGLNLGSRDFYTSLPGQYTNPLNGSTRNTAFNFSALATGTNTPFLSSATDGLPSTLFGTDLVNRTISYPGTVLYNINSTYYTPYTAITSGAGATLKTSNYITFNNGLSPVGFSIGAKSAAGAATSISTFNNTFQSTTSQLIQGTPGAAYISGNGLNGYTVGGVPKQATGVAFTTFAPTSLPSNVTSTQVFANYGVTPPAGSTVAQLNALAAGILAANRFTAREFLAANQGLNPNYYIGTFSNLVPRIANTDTTLVNVRVDGNTVKVPVNQVLPFVAVPLEFNQDGSIRQFTASGALAPASPLTAAISSGSNGGNRNSYNFAYLRPQQERYIANLIGHLDITNNLTLFTENLYARVNNTLIANAASANSITNGAENAALLLNVNNPYLSASNLATLASVGIAANQANRGNFTLTRFNQDIFGNNVQKNNNETYRILLGLREKFSLFGHEWHAEASGNYGRVQGTTKTTTINDVEYQLALDAVDQGLASGGAANGNIVCRAQLFPAQYLGKTPIGIQGNVTRLPGADGIPTEQVVTPTITQDMITACKPLNPFGYNQMTDAAKQYVRQDVTFKSVGQQTFLQSSVAGGLFNLPAGELGVSIAGEYRKEQADYSSTLLNRLGRGRTAPSSNTSAKTETFEFGGESRIPITGPDFLGFLGDLVFNPAVRVTKQNGSAGTFRNIAGALVSPSSKGDYATIYSLAGTWRPIRDVMLRGNYTKSVRQPSIVELFLGGQPVFTTPTDYCTPTNIDGGTNATVSANRRKNCTAAVIANNVIGADGNSITTSDAATSFLSTYTAAGISLPGSYSGTPGVKPERGKSWTVGGVFSPRIIPGLTLTGDYIDLTIAKVITPTGLGQAIQACYESPTYPDSSAQTGVNLCSSFARGTDFQILPGYQLGFLNLGSTLVQAINITGSYTQPLGSFGNVTLNGSAYHLIHYKDSSAGDFSDSVESAGTFGRPSWKAVGSLRFEKAGFYTQLTYEWQQKTRIFVNGAPATNEVLVDNAYPAIGRFDLAFGARINSNIRMQFLASNLTDKIYPGNFSQNGYLNQAYVDQIGRRYQVQVTTKF